MWISFQWYAMFLYCWGLHGHILLVCGTYFRLLKSIKHWVKCEKDWNFQLEPKPNRTESNQYSYFWHMYDTILNNMRCVIQSQIPFASPSPNNNVSNTYRGQKNIMMINSTGCSLVTVHANDTSVVWSKQKQRDNFYNTTFIFTSIRIVLEAKIYKNKVHTLRVPRNPSRWCWLSGMRAKRIFIFGKEGKKGFQRMQTMCEIM